MASTKYEQLKNLKLGTCEEKIQVRVIRFWRGVTTTGEEFKNFNVILLDNKNTTIHAFIPVLCAYEHERKLKLGNVCIIKTFTVETYKITEKFRTLRNDKKLIFSKDTKIQQIEETGSHIPQNWFDLYDHSEFTEMSKQTLYLADVVGIVKDFVMEDKVRNRNGKDQAQAKFIITDGSSNVNVTFWDDFAKGFEKEMLGDIEKPVILIIASCRIGWWNDQVNLSHVPATRLYYNYPHQSVIHLRKLLTLPGFKDQALAPATRKKAKLISIQKLLNLGPDYIDNEVLIHAKIVNVEEVNKWYYYACTSCLNKTDQEEGKFICIKCNRSVPYPELKFKISAVVSDGSSPIQVILDDREVRAIIAKRAEELVDEEAEDQRLPLEIKNMANKDYTIKLEIRETNVTDKFMFFWAKNICNGFKLEEEDIQQPSAMELSTTQATSSSFHLDAISELNFQTPTTKNKGKGHEDA